MVIQLHKNYHKKQKICPKKLNNQEKLINYKKLYFKRGDKVDYDFTNFSFLREFFIAIYYREIFIPGAEREQGNFDDIIKILEAINQEKILNSINLSKIF